MTRLILTLAAVLAVGCGPSSAEIEALKVDLVERRGVMNRALADETQASLDVLDAAPGEAHQLAKLRKQAASDAYQKAKDRYFETGDKLQALGVNPNDVK